MSTTAFVLTLLVLCYAVVSGQVKRWYVAPALALGAIGGLVIARSRRREWMSDTWAQLSTLAVALVCFQVGERLDGSGLVTAFAGGLAFAFAARRAGGRPDTHVSEAAGQLLELVVFAMFGAYAVIAGWRDAEWRVVVFAVVAVFGVRLVAVSVALIRSDLPASNRLFIGWFGPRGLGTIVLGLLMIEEGETQLESSITQVVAIVVTLSLVVHSLTAWPGIRWLAARESPRPTAEPSGGGRPGPRTTPRPPRLPMPPPGRPGRLSAGPAAKPDPASRNR
jgi:sodium/hydrogen antiporter